MPYPKEIYICRNMMCNIVDDLLNADRIKPTINKCLDFAHGICEVDGRRCKMVAYTKVKEKK